jgi:GDPmannose 4,6-dehydratase
MARIALITGITGQDGSYLAELLLAKGYEVHGLIRRASSFNTDRIEHLYRDPHDPEARLFLHHGDLDDPSRLRDVLSQCRPDEVYNLAAQSHVRVSFDMPLHTLDLNGTGTARLLEAIRDYQQASGAPVRFYQASTSEMFGGAPPPQNEQTPFLPRSPYAAAKALGSWITVNYREAYGMHASNGILFNHESARRGETFVTRKVTRAVGRIKHGLQQKLYLGNLDAVRDWGFAGDFVEAMWLMLQQEEPGDYVVATDEPHSVRELLEAAFGRAALDWRQHVEIDPRYYRPTDVHNLQGDSRRAREALGWRPRVGFEQLVAMMVDADLILAEREKTLRDAGHTGPLRFGPESSGAT